MLPDAGVDRSVVSSRHVHLSSDLFSSGLLNAYPLFAAGVIAFSMEI
jgi:hypothetical protein